MFETIGQITVAAVAIYGGWYAYKQGCLVTPAIFIVKTVKGWLGK
jgi:hypothetical protein